MPDWFYRTVAQRALFLLPDEAARTVALGVIGGLGRSRAGGAVIDFMGHMAPDPRLAVRVAGVELASPMALGWRVDPEGIATAGLARFGVGAIELPAIRGVDVNRGDDESLVSGPLAGDAPPPRATMSPPVLLRRDHELVLPNGVALAVVAWDDPGVGSAEPPVAGLVLQVGSRTVDGGWRVPAAMPPELPELVAAWRRRLPAEAALVVAGGVADPTDAVALRQAGADLMLVDAGLVFRGPGLVKRCNEALLTLAPSATTVAPAREENVFRQSSLWAALLGASLFVGGLMTLLLAFGRVLLPYDEHYLGLTAEALRRNVPKLFAFMAHDRGILAGTMLGLGWIYLVLAGQGIRRGVHGAKTAVAASALTGFASFFAFFGFGYFDTLHAFVAAVLAQLTIQVLVGSAGLAAGPAGVIDREDATWRRAQWGQLCWVIHAVGLLIAGATILGIGMSAVFVAEDLDFLCLGPVPGQALGEKLVAVVAHDRATLGGMLLSSGVAMLLPVLWCFRRGSRWLWTAVAGLGLPAYGAALAAHFMTGYVDARHLLPAVAGLLLWAGGLGLTRSFLGEDR